VYSHALVEHQFYQKTDNWSGSGRYGRTVGRVYVGSEDVNAEMVKQGAAWVYRKYAKDPSLYRLEEQAKAARRGLWGLPEAQRRPP